MLARMIVGGQSLLTGAGGLASSADFIVTSDAEWDAVFANSAATLAGKTVEVRGSNFTPRTIASKDMDAAGAPLTIRSANASASIPALTLSGTVRGIDFSGFNFQMTGWPRLAGACLTFGTGTFGKLRFINGTSFRHGYGAGLADIDTSAELPEYARINHVQTATTTSAAYPLTWENPAVPTGAIQFFNWGSQTVYVAVGGAGVVATAGSTACLPGTRTAIFPLTIASSTHFAILAASGTVQVNARTEIGLGQYLAEAFAASGAADVEDLYFRNVVMRDLSNGYKNLGRPNSLVIMDCDTDRIYQDIVATPPRPTTGVAYYLRNIEGLPFSRAGLGEAENGDAGDPHGDQFQTFSDGTGAIGPIYYAGTRVRPGNLRSNVSSQGALVSTNAINPAYRGLYFISSMFVGGAPIGMSFGFTGQNAIDSLIYGCLVTDWRNPANTLPRFAVYTDSSGSFYLGKTLAGEFQFFAGEIMREDNLTLPSAPSPAAVLPGITNLPNVARTRAAIEGAIATAAEGAGLGPVATAHAVDWTTSDHTAVIRWENVPSGAHWNALTQRALNTVVTLPLRKILNRRPAQAVSVGSGTEWRSVATDGTTQVQAWTTSPGTIEPDQFIQIRRTSAAGGSETVTASVTINGFEQDVAITTANIPSVFLVMPATLARFEDTANTPAGTSRMTFRGKFFFPTGTVQTGDRLISQGFNSCHLDVGGVNGRSFRISVNDSTGANMLAGTLSRQDNRLVVDTWLDIVFDVNMALNQATLTVNGVTETYPFIATSNGLMAATRFSLLARDNTNNGLNATVRVADLSLDFNGTLRKAISNTAATANADAWKLGAGGFANA
jgi:hypothetical protein